MYEEEKVNIGVVSPFDYSIWTSNTDWIDAVTRVGHFNAPNLSLSVVQIRINLIWALVMWPMRVLSGIRN
ncbi:MAG: hypothetical protein IPP72_16470 [Chitinophagaceae bacterium]|nr:hypothetical protein [Chitinophagaceae bacterium]